MNEKQRKAIIKGRAAVSSSNLEQGIGNEPVGEKKAKGFNRCVSIHYRSIRKRLADSDGLCSKYVTDALVDVGILRGDDPQCVKEVSYSQEKGKEEKTIIEIMEA